MRKIIIIPIALLLLVGCAAQNAPSAVDSSQQSNGLWQPIDLSQLTDGQSVTDKHLQSGTGPISPSSAPQESTAEAPPEEQEPAAEPYWLDRACSWVPFAEDPAGCISYVMWERLQARLNAMREDSWESELARPHCIGSAGLADLDMDGVPELILYEPPAKVYVAMVYDLSGDQPVMVGYQETSGSLRIDRVCNENGKVITRMRSSWCIAATSADVYGHMEKLEDGSWDQWRYTHEQAINPDTKNEWNRYSRAHNDGKYETIDETLFRQVETQPAANGVPMIHVSGDWYGDLLSDAGYDPVGEDWWIVYGKLLWQKYEQALQEEVSAIG